MSQAVDVVVVGAGPVGLLAAIEAKLGGASVLVLERLAAPSTVMKALGVGPLGAEALLRRGMGPSIASAEARAFAAMKTFTASLGMDVVGGRQNGRGGGQRIGGHFAGLSLIRLEAQSEPDRRARLVDQHAVEAMLAARAATLGIEVRRAHEVTGFVQDADGIVIDCVSPMGAERIRCAWLVGCDGGRSAIRKMGGFDFPGTPPTMTMYSAVVEIDHPERLLPAGWRHTSGGVFAHGPFPGRLFLLDFSGPPTDRQAPVTREEIETVLRRISGADVRVTRLESGNRWTDNTRLVDTYRRGRVLLAGDAAHIHSSFGGQGMSLGLVDAANLGWKLAAVLRGAMPESLLDTYSAERRPVAAAVLANTLAQAAIMRPDPQSAAMRDLMAGLMALDDVNRRIGAMMSGLATRYDLGSDQEGVGRLVADRAIRHGDGEVRLYDLMRDGAGILLDASYGGRASELVSHGTQHITCIPIETGPSMLIRPDACVAWLSETGGTDGLDDALHSWFGRDSVRARNDLYRGSEPARSGRASVI